MAHYRKGRELGKIHEAEKVETNWGAIFALIIFLLIIGGALSG